MSPSKVHTEVASHHSDAKRLRFKREQIKGTQVRRLEITARRELVNNPGVLGKLHSETSAFSVVTKTDVKEQAKKEPWSSNSPGALVGSLSSEEKAKLEKIRANLKSAETKK